MGVLKTNYDKLEAFSKLMVKASMIGFAICFAYLIIWRTFILGLFSGLTFQETVAMNLKDGFSDVFIHGMLFFFLLSATVFMFVSSSLSIKKMSEVFDARGGEIGEIVKKIPELELKVAAKTSIFYEFICYSSYGLFFFYSVFYESYFKTMEWNGYLISSFLVSIPFLCIGIIASRASSRKTDFMTEVISKTLCEMHKSILEKKNELLK